MIAGSCLDLLFVWLWERHNRDRFYNENTEIAQDAASRVLTRLNLDPDDESSKLTFKAEPIDMRPLQEWIAANLTATLDDRLAKFKLGFQSERAAIAHTLESVAETQVGQKMPEDLQALASILAAAGMGKKQIMQTIGALIQLRGGNNQSQAPTATIRQPGALA